MPPYDDVIPKSRTAWRAWLQKHHASATGVWVHLAKKHTGLPTVGYNDAVEEALCFGWIDGLAHPVDAAYYKQLFTPRKPRSAWAASNKARVEKLIAGGLMTPAGLAAIEIAKANGSWDRYNAVDAGTVPADLGKALKQTPGATKAFADCTPGKRKQFLYYLNDAKKPETRARRIASIIEWVSSATKAATRTKTTTSARRR